MALDAQTLAVVAQLAALNAVATPFIVAALTKTKWRSQVKTLAALGCVLVSAALALLQQGVSFTDVSIAIPIAAYAVEKAYQHGWKDTGLLAWLSQVTDALMGEQRPRG